MKNRAGSVRAWMPLLAMLTSLADPGAAFAQATQPPIGTGASKTPDLSGVWEMAGFGENRRREPLPLTQWATELYEYNRDTRPGGEGRGRLELDPRGRDCFPPSPNWLMSSQEPFQIIHVSPTNILLLFEYDHWFRQIWLNEQRPDYVDLTWMGNSIGKWDGDTLVVDTIRMHDGSWFDGAGHVRSTELHMVERFKRVIQNRMEIDVTFEDPKAFTRPWSEKRAYNLKPDWKILEHIFCSNRLQKDFYDTQ